MNYTFDGNRYNLDLSGITALVFEIKACTWSHVLLSSSSVRNSSEPLYEIVFINFMDVYRLYIIYCSYGSLDSRKCNIEPFVHQIKMNCTMYLPFWISWAGGDIRVGTGIDVSANVLGNFTNTDNFDVRSIGIFTEGSRLGNWIIQIEGNFKLCTSFAIFVFFSKFIKCICAL